MRCRPCCRNGCSVASNSIRRWGLKLVLTDAHGMLVGSRALSPTVGKTGLSAIIFTAGARSADQPDGYGTPIDVAPIRGPHRSAVFDSQASGNRIVAFSVPVWSEPSESGPPEVVGVLGMTVQLGHFGELNPW